MAREPDTGTIHPAYCGCRDCDDRLRWWEIVGGIAGLLGLAALFVIFH